MTQSTELCAVHVQPVPVVTVKVPVPPFTGTVLWGGVKVYRHEALWVTTKVWPETLIVPMRWRGVGFGCTLYPAVPLPVPVCPNVIVIHDTLLETVRWQPDGIAVNAS
jgi:hypothetical protein